MGMRSIPGSEISLGDEVWFPWQPGDKIQRAGHTPERDLYWLVTAVGESYFLAKTFSPHQTVYEEKIPKSDGWVLYVEPVVYPELWFNVYMTGGGAGHSARLAATCRAGQQDCIGVLHLHPDGSTTMEPVNSLERQTP